MFPLGHSFGTSKTGVLILLWTVVEFLEVVGFHNQNLWRSMVPNENLARWNMCTKHGSACGRAAPGSKNEADRRPGRLPLRRLVGIEPR